MSALNRAPRPSEQRHDQLLAAPARRARSSQPEGVRDARGDGLGDGGDPSQGQDFGDPSGERSEAQPEEGRQARQRQDARVEQSQLCRPHQRHQGCTVTEFVEMSFKLSTIDPQPTKLR